MTEYDTAVRARDEGMRRAEDHADKEWKVLAWDTLVAYFDTHDEFFCDDFWLETRLPWPREARAIGPLILRAARAGLIEKTGASRPSVRSNLTPKPVWRVMS